MSKDIAVCTQNDDNTIADSVEITALEKLPLVDIGMQSDWNFNIVTMIELKVCIQQEGKNIDTLYAKLESEVTTDIEKKYVAGIIQSFPCC